MEKKYTGKVRVHPLPKFYEGVHVDTCISIIGYNKKVKKYIAIFEGVKISNPTNIPAIFRGKNWAIISFEKHIQHYMLPDYEFTSFHMGLNILTINPELVAVVDSATHLIETLDFYGIKSIVVTNRQMCHLCGGCHCNTNDINR